MTNTPAGWYPQPDGQQRYWDGQQWTNHFAPGTGESEAAPAPTTSYGAASTPPSSRPWFKKKRFLIPGGAFVLLFLFGMMGAALGSGGDTDLASDTVVADTQQSEEAVVADDAEEATTAPEASTKPSKAAPKKKQPSGPKIGSKVRDGKFEFVVTGMKCGISRVGDEYFNTKAQGQFCRLDMTISNIGDEAQTMFADNQVAFDAKGRKFSADGEASVYDNKSEVLFEEINPGNSVKGRVYFDVPKNSRPTKVELHDSIFSGGVEVALK